MRLISIPSGNAVQLSASPDKRESRSFARQKAMPHYRVLLNGRNFWLRVEDKQERMGFYTTRFVEAGSPEAAELAAVDLLRVEGELKPLNDRRDPPRILVDEIEEVDPANVPQVVQGFTFFLDENEND